MEKNFETANRSCLTAALLAYENLTTALPKDISADDMDFNLYRKDRKPVTYKRCTKKLKKHFSDLLVFLISTQWIAREETEHHTRAYFFDTEGARDDFIDIYTPKGGDVTIEPIEPSELLEYTNGAAADPENYYVNGKGNPVFVIDSLQAD